MIWAAMPDRMYQTVARSRDRHEAAIVWRSLQSIVDGAFDELRNRLQACVDKKEHFEHFYDIKAQVLTGCAHELDIFIYILCNGNV